jgi:hypothetical protein
MPLQTRRPEREEKARQTIPDAVRVNGSADETLKCGQTTQQHDQMNGDLYNDEKLEDVTCIY